MPRYAVRLVYNGIVPNKPFILNWSIGAVDEAQAIEIARKLSHQKYPEQARDASPSLPLVVETPGDAGPNRQQ